MPPKDKYTDPELRDQVKEELKQSDKGGEPGQWSARKAQMMAQEYKKRGGGYTTDKDQGQDESQKNLEKWGEEEWQTKDGEGDARNQDEDGTTKRYLPKKAWEKMSEKEKEDTDQKKKEESKEGKQFVSNTRKAKGKRKEANQEEHEDFESRKQNGSQRDDEDDEDDEGDDAAVTDDDEDEYHDAEEGDQGEDEGDESEEEAGDGDAEFHQVYTGEKRKANKQSNGSAKKQQKSNSGGKQHSNRADRGDRKDGTKGNAPDGKVGSKHMPADAPAAQGSKDRLPKKGQEAHWKAMPGWVDGKVKEVLTQGKEVDGKSVKASKDDPKIVLESHSSGKICVHKIDSCYYE